MEQKTSNEMWTRIINDARFYDGSPQMLMQLISHFEAQGYVLSQKCEQCNVSSSGDNNCYEDDEEDEERDGHWECEFCGGEDGRHIGYDCPNDDSPYALLLRRGYD